MMNKQRFFFIGAIICFSVFGLALKVQAMAISPLKQHITLAPGAENYTISVTVKNEENETKSYALIVLGAKQLDNGNIVYGERNNPAENWVRPEKSSISIGKGEEQSVNFIINIPINAVAGSYVLGLVAGIGADTSEEAVGLTGQVASVLMLQVAGVVNESMSVEKYDLPALTISREWPAIIELKNIGTTELPVHGSLTARDWLGREIYNQEINFGQVILPQSGRSYLNTIDLSEKFIFPGPCDTELKIVYGLTGQKIYRAEHVWYLPVYFWIIVALVASSIIYKLYRRKKFSEKI